MWQSRSEMRSGTHQWNSPILTWRDCRGGRETDHREVAGTDGVPGKTGEAMDAFIRSGAMRMDHSGTVSLGKAPTRSQESVIRSLAEKNSGEVAIDATDGARKFGR